MFSPSRRSTTNSAIVRRLCSFAQSKVNLSLPKSFSLNTIAHSTLLHRPFTTTKPLQLYVPQTSAACTPRLRSFLCELNLQPDVLSTTESSTAAMCILRPNTRAPLTNLNTQPMFRTSVMVWDTRRQSQTCRGKRATSTIECHRAFGTCLKATAMVQHALIQLRVPCPASC